MEDIININPQVGRLSDILEQVRDLNRLLKLHEKKGSQFIYKQFEFRKRKLLKELREILLSYEINAADLAA